MAVVIIIFSCANPVAPTGGPRDTRAPKVVSCNPPDYSIHFTKKTITITFDEFITLDQPPEEKIILSPPSKNKPEYKLKSKSLIITLTDTLYKNTTYTFFFGDAIKDMNEGNPIGDFQYIFSSGDYLDSLTLKGSIENALTCEPEKNVWVMLYESSEDSLPYKAIPYYISRTDDNGDFYFFNLRTRAYKLFVLRDANSNYLYDLPDEQIAFSDSLVEPWIQKPVILGDTNASTPVKTLIFFLFQESDSIQRVMEAKTIREGFIQMVFRYPIKNLDIQYLNQEYTSDKFIQSMNQARDTLLLWIKPQIPDSLSFVICDEGMDPDTISISLAAPGRNLKSSKRDTEVPKLVFSTDLVNQNRLAVYKPLLLNSPYPLKTVDFSRVLLLEGKDTVKAIISLSDPIKRSICLNYKWKENQSYEMLIPDSVFSDIMDYRNDSIILKFTTTSYADYGSLKMDIQTGVINKQIIIQLLDEKNTILNSEVITTDTILEFRNLLPGKYKLRAVIDDNRNRHWDTGTYLSHQQPEKVIYYNKVFDIRANWIYEESWSL
jgi:hypothetical protein